MRKGTRGNEAKEAKSLQKKIREAFKAKAMDLVEKLFATMQRPNTIVKMVNIHPTVACRLPSCNRTHKHNGGYCCAEHHDTHQPMLPKKDVAVLTKRQVSWRYANKLPGGLLVPIQLIG
jgi:hypothetical protein